MDITGRAKVTFPLRKNELYARGERLIRESLECGVTSMRAHVEVDSIVGLTCLEVGLALKKAYENLCDIRIAGSRLPLLKELLALMHISVPAGTYVFKWR